MTGVKAVDDSVYWDTLLTQKGDPQIAFNHFDQDYPEGEDFIDTLLNGEHIVNVGNNDVSNTDDPEINRMIDQTEAAPARRRAERRLGEHRQPFMQRDAGWAPFLHLQQPKFVSARLHGLVFTGSLLRADPGDVAIAVTIPPSPRTPTHP